MKRKILTIVLPLICSASVFRVQAETTFAGELLTGNASGLAAGSISLSVDRGQVSFSATLFQSYATGTTLEPVLVAQNKSLPFSFGTGTAGSWPLGQFFGPVAGIAPIPFPCLGGIDPGFDMPMYAEGTSFAGTFTSLPGLEGLMSAQGGTIYLQVHGLGSPAGDLFFSSPLQRISNPIPTHFTATLSGRSEVPLNASPSGARATFTLTGNCLEYTLDELYLPCLPLSLFSSPSCALAIVGPAGRGAASTEVVASLSPFMFAINPGTGQIASIGGGVVLSDAAIEDLNRGKLYLNLLTAQYPQGELRGQILPVAEHDRSSTR